MAKHIDDAILNYLADQIQRLAPDEQEWLLNNLTGLVRERMTEIGEPTHTQSARVRRSGSRNHERGI